MAGLQNYYPSSFGRPGLTHTITSQVATCSMPPHQSRRGKSLRRTRQSSSRSPRQSSAGLIFPAEITKTVRTEASQKVRNVMRLRHSRCYRELPHTCGVLFQEMCWATYTLSVSNILGNLPPQNRPHASTIGKSPRGLLTPGTGPHSLAHRQIYHCTGQTPSNLAAPAAAGAVAGGGYTREHFFKKPGSNQY